MLGQMPSRLLSEWMAYYTVEPFGEERADWRAAMLAALYANAHRREDAEPVSIEDFMPRYDGTESEMDDEELEAWQMHLAIVEQLNKTFGGRDLRGRKP